MFKVRITYREEWGADKLSLIEMEDATIKELYKQLEKLVNDNTLVVKISIWNIHKINKLNES